MPATASLARQVRPEELVEGLSSSDTTARLKALRDVKNQIIGNKTKKLSYIKLGAVPRVVEILASDTDIPLLVQSAAAVGSFACGIDAGVRAVLDSGVLPHLLKMLSNSDPKVVEAGARSLRMIFQSTLAPRGIMCVDRTMELILALLTSQTGSVAEVAASVLARCCEAREHQNAVASAGGMHALVALLGGGPDKTTEAALDALAAMVKNNEDLASMLVEMEGGAVARRLCALVLSKAPRTRLLACLCLANLVAAHPQGLVPPMRDVRPSALAVLIRLLDEPGQVGEEAPAVLEALVGQCEDLHRAAQKAGAITQLAALLLRAAPACSAKQRENIFLCLATLCSRIEANRRQLIDHKALGHILEALDHPSGGVRAAACSCLRYAARSVKNLRLCLADAKVAAPLFRLLNDPSPPVQVAAAAALCNVVMDFHQDKTAVLVAAVAGGLERLCQLAQSMGVALRLSSVWALRNLLYRAELAVKAEIMEHLSFVTLVHLLEDSEEEVQEAAMGIARNLAHGRPDDIALLVGFNHGAVLAAVGRQLYTARRPEICIQALYVMGNIATGSEAHKEAVMACLVPPRHLAQGPNGAPLLLNFLHSPDGPQLRVAALWCVVNLSFPEGPGVQSRVARMRVAGLEQQLRALVSDPCLDVKDRAVTALEQFLQAGYLN